MFEALSRLFRRNQADRTSEIRAHVKSLKIAHLKEFDENIENRIAKTMFFIIGKQILDMGFELEGVPANDQYLTNSCRGYLLGITDGIIIHENKKVDPNFAEFVRESAFVLVFGRQFGPSLAHQTSAEFGPGSDLARGYVFGTQEVEAIFFGDGGEITRGCGFELFSSQEQPDTFIAAIEQAAREATAEVNWDDPAERTGVSLYLVLSKQFDLIGKREGVFPFTPPFATDKARGALLGTAIAISRREYSEPPHQAVVDAAVAAFVLAYGHENGRFYALQTLKDSTDGNEDVNFASDWAIKDTDGSIDEHSPATPAAFYLAVAGMI